MTRPEPMDRKNHSDNVICPHCGASLPSYTIFCGNCGRRIKKYEEEEAHAEKGDDAQEQEVDDTLRISAVSQAQWKDLQSDQQRKDNEITGQTYKSNLLPLDVGAPISEQLTTPLLLASDFDPRKLSALPLFQPWEQETRKIPSIAHTVYQQIVGTLGSNSRFTRRNGTLIKGTEDALDRELASVETPKLSTPPNNNSTVTESHAKTWGWLPILSLTSAVGVFLLALAYEAARLSWPWSDLLFWLSLLVIFLPIAVRIFSIRPSRQERIALLIIQTIAFYCVQYLQYPLYFTGYDEFIHVRTEQDILASGHLFHVNPLLPISAFYPGLEIATNALSSLTGLSIFAAGIVLIGLTRLLIVLALYLFFEYLSESSRIAAIGTLIYMINPGYIFFDQIFSYESLALALALFVVFTIAYRGYVHAGRHRGLTLAIWLALGAVVITHHITSYALVAFLFLWAAVFLLLRMVPSFRQNRPKKVLASSSPGGVALLGLALIIAWLIFTGDLAIGYLAPHIDNIVQQIMQILAHESAPRQLFNNPSGFVTPLWQRLISYASVALIGLGLPFGLFQIWRHHRANAVALALATGSLAYPVSQALRLTPAGGETGDRATEFVFVGIAFVLAIAATKFWFSSQPNWRRSAMIIGAVGVISFGQMALGSGQSWNYLPGPYLVSADTRSIEPEGIAASQWAGSYLEPGHRVASDRINTLLMLTYGREYVVTGGSSNVPVAQIFSSLSFGPGVMNILQQDRVQYLVVDLRLSTSLPYVGTYFNQPASGGESIDTPINPAALTKFDGLKNVDRLFDSGNIVIYNVDGLVNGQSAITAPQPACTPTPLAAESSSYPNVAKTYTGELLDIPTGLTTNISLTGIQQQQGSICGSFGGIATGPLKGTISTAGQIQFIVTSSTGQPSLTFNGILLPDGTMTGTYCSSGGGTGTCSDYGLWSVSHA